MAMGKVVEFELKSGKTIDPPRHAAGTASLSLALAEHLQTIEVCCRSFEKDIRTIESIARLMRLRQSVEPFARFAKPGVRTSGIVAASLQP